MKHAATILTLLAGFAVGLFISRRKTGEVSLTNIRRGIKNGWYSAMLLEVDGKYYAELSGTRTDGTPNTGVYEISKATFDALKSDGLQVKA